MARSGILKIAERCGVSHMTVSRILTGKADLHSPKTVALVRKVADEMGYRPNLVAQSMQTGHTRMIGVVLRSSHGSWFSDIQCGIHDRLVERGYLPLTLEMSGDREQNAKRLNHMLDRRVEGLILWYGGEDVLEESLRAKLPVVTIDTPPPETAQLDFVGTDDTLGGRLAAEHLLDLGHRRVAAIAFEELPTMRERREAFRAAVESVESAGCQEVAVTGHDNDVARGLIKELLSQDSRPTAVFAATDKLAWLVISEAHAMGLSVPEDLSVVGYADLDFAEMITPALTTVRQAPTEIGQRASDLLLNRIEAKDEPERPEYVLLKPELVVRQSTAPCK